jgi:stage II sporulation protein AA (anti-sigma F factor antagonist)
VPEITTRGGGGLTRLVVVTGEVVDPPHATQLYEAICEEVHHRAKTVEVDLSGVELFGSQAINGLLHAYQDAKRLGCAVTIVSASPFVRRVLEITDLTDLFGLD